MTQDSSPSPNETEKSKNRSGYHGLYACVAAFSTFLFNLFRTSFVGRFFTSYSRTEAALTGSGRSERFARAARKLRQRISGRLESNFVLNGLKSAGRFLAWSPINMYGIFFLLYGLVSGGITLVSGFSDDSVNIGKLILSVIITASAIPLICISGSIMEVLPVSRLAKNIADGFMAFPEKKAARRIERRNMVVMMYVGIFTGVIFGALTFYYDVIIVPLAFVAAALFATVLVYPETGVVLLIGLLPFIMLFDPHGILLPALVLTVWFSYLFKLLLGRRTIRFGLLDWVIILFMVNTLLCGIASPGGTASFIDSLRLVILMSAYFPIVNLIKTTEWAQRCIKLLVINSSVIAYAYIIMFFFGDKMLKWCAGVNAGLFGIILEGVSAAFDSATLMPCFFILMVPLAVMSLHSFKRLFRALMNLLTMAAFIVCVFLTMDGWAWLAATIGIIIMPALYSPGSLSATLIALFPFTCAGFWLPSLNDKYLRLERFTPVEAASDAIVNAFSHKNGQIIDNVIKMIKDNPFGIGTGRSAFEAAYPLYAEVGSGIASYVNSFYLGVTVHFGMVGMILIVFAVILFMKKCFEFFIRADNRGSCANVLALLAGFSAILIYGIYNWIWADPAVFLLFWAVIAVSSAFINCGYDDNVRNCAEHGVTSLSSDITIFR